MIAGGVISNMEGTASALRYSVRKNSWDFDVPSMSTGRACLTSVAIGGRMMIFGGYYGNQLATCEAFDPCTNSWSRLPPMSTPRSSACAIAWQGRAFVFGGLNQGGIASSAECFDPTLNRWSAIAPMTTARYRAAAVAIPGRGPLVIGGYGAGILQSAELFHPLKNRWTTMKWKLPKPLYDFAAHCIHGVLHIIGGYTSNRAVAECWSMDLSAEFPVWSALSPLPCATAGFASVSLTTTF